MRQVAGLMRVINKAKSIDFYKSTLSYASVKGVKIPSLDEYLGVSSEEASSLDPKTEAALEAHAQKRLKERRKKLGGTT
jgi:hypothetical protein